MGRDAAKACENQCFRCRKEAAKHNDKLGSREGAAELLGISVSSLADYELGNTKVIPVDKVVLMADIYNAPELMAWYCSSECLIGKSLEMPSPEIASVERTTMKLLKQLRQGDIEQVKEKLIDITADKLARLKHLKEAALKTKETTDALGVRIKALEDVGAQANVIESIKVNGTAQAISSKSVNITVPTKVGDLTNDQKFQTETQVSTAISKAVAAADHLKRKVVNSTADIDLKAADASQYIYMVSKGTAGEADKYDEYMVIDGVLEKMGDWGVDLSGYVQKETGKGLSTNDYTNAEKTKLGGIEEGANKYTHPTHTAAASGLYKVTVDALGHVTATTKVVKNDITGLGIPAQDTTYAPVTQSANGLMTASDKTKLDGMTIATDAEVTEMLTEVFGATA